MTINSAIVIDIIKSIAKTLAENKEYLTELDSAIGDADHGINMDRGFNTVLTKLPSLEGKDIGTILKTVGMTLVSTVGGASGPLYGTAFMRAGQAVAGKNEIDEKDILTIFEAALQGIKERGKAVAGEKTMIDALEPALKSYRDAVDNNIGLAEALNRAVDAAKEGMEYTKNIIATKGRASYLGERSIGHQDPGATSSYLLLQAAARVVNSL
ncbi:dihydroxyacetone kinase subunit DhaL [Calorimonas adulescens]|uniref:phosphoenolpyruvate--glycerone phosphotransferase n=1 Tax=Calorimonas adulescens TaxID=2606906 RepID=A0A5D8QF14_9THEO|nr:dihydroxyacetone kinase subunit DhaL [Calorimonas adulescens]TZE83017.1 dihydroxyacetone kinase subunit L [Calorimonas adulescens]